MLVSELLSSRKPYPCSYEASYHPSSPADTLFASLWFRSGDNKNTAETICREIGVFGQTEDLTGKSYTGREFEGLSHEEKLVAVQKASLFSRTEPTHKSELVDLLQSLGLVVAMVSGELLFFAPFSCSARG
jgi:hypothetical protein